MIISHKYKFIFIKTVKTAGTSIELFLSQCCGERDTVTPILPHVEPHRARNHRGFWNPLPEILYKSGPGIGRTLYNLSQRAMYYNHIPASLVKHRTAGSVWDTYFKFCVDRNPWDKTLSHYHMINDRAGGGISFDEYINKGSYCLNYPTYTDDKGRLLVDKVIKYESLNEELEIVFKELGVPFDGALGVRAKSEHRSDRRPYQDVFSDKQKMAIQEAFRAEISMHDYRF